MLTAAQVDARRSGIGGSDAAAACGLSRWKSPLQVYLEKRGETPAFEGNEATRWGNALEPAIRQAYSDETGRVVRLPVETLRHPGIPLMLCHPDGVTDDGRLFEAKNTRSADGWGEPGTDDIPQEYLVQVQHNMFVAALPVADVAVLIGGSDFRLYQVVADAEFHELLVRAESDLWSRIERGDPPTPKTAEDVRLLFGRASVEREVEAGVETAAIISALVDLKAHARAIEAEIEEAEVAVKLALGEADTLTYQGKTLATWRAAKAAARLDVAALRAAHPEIAAAFTRTGEATRRFLLKG